MPGAQILLIEDDAVLSELFRHNLEARAHHVYLARDAQSALSCLQTVLFDLVILDINLPDRTGWEILRIAQQEGWLQVQTRQDSPPTLPVIVVSAVWVSLAQLKEFALLAYLPKPFPLESLLRLAEQSARPAWENAGKEVDTA